MQEKVPNMMRVDTPKGVSFILFKQKTTLWPSLPVLLHFCKPFKKSLGNLYPAHTVLQFKYKQTQRTITYGLIKK